MMKVKVYKIGESGLLKDYAFPLRDEIEDEWCASLTGQEITKMKDSIESEKSIFSY